MTTDTHHTPTDQAWLNQLKPGDIINIQTPDGVTQETVKRLTPYPRSPETVTIYTDEGGIYWRNGGHSRLTARFNHFILCPQEKD